MAQLLYPTLWTRQPQTLVGIDWSNPLTQGLVGVVRPEFNREIFTGNVGTPQGGSNLSVVPDIQGRGLRAATTAATQGMDYPGTWPRINGNMSFLLVSRMYAAPVTNVRTAGTYAGSTSQSYGFSPTVANFRFLYVGAGNTLSVVTGAATDLAPHVHLLTVAGTSETMFMDGRRITNVTGPGAITAHVAADFIIEGDNAGGSSTTESVFLCAVWNRCLQDAEGTRISANPWQIFAPLPRRVWMGVSGGSSSGVGNADGVATADGVGKSLANSVGNADGVSTVAGVGKSLANSVGNADGIADVSGFAASLFDGVGNADGVGTAEAFAPSIASGVGNADGVGTAEAVSAPAVTIDSFYDRPSKRKEKYSQKREERDDRLQDILQMFEAKMEPPKIAPIVVQPVKAKPAFDYERDDEETLMALL